MNKVSRFEHAGAVGTGRHDDDVRRSEDIIDHEHPTRAPQDRPSKSRYHKGRQGEDDNR
jgi:hypothetical protein